MEKIPNFSEEIATEWEAKKEFIKNKLISLCEEPPEYDLIKPLLEITSGDTLWNTYSEDKKNEIRKAEETLKRFSVEMYSLPELRYGVEEFARLKYMSLSRIPISHDVSSYNQEYLDELVYGERSQERIKGKMAHENAHMNAAETLGVEGKMYSIIPYSERGSLQGAYATVIEKYPDHWSLEKAIEVGIKINEAPETYDEQGKLSEFDRNEIERLKSSLEK